MAEFDIFIKRLKEGAKNVNFRDVINSSTGKEIAEVTPELQKELLKIKNHFTKNLSKINTTIKNIKGRSNELSNKMEGVVAEEIQKINGFSVERPESTKGGKQAVAYPDLLVSKDKLKFYLEVKIFQTKSKDSSLRSFYYKVSKNSKITHSCSHILIGFEIDAKGGNNRAPFIIKDFKMIDLYELKVSLKPEFNASNNELYKCNQI